MSTLLLVEDDMPESRLYQNLFRFEHFQVVAIDNGQDCHAKAVEIKPDIILLDIMMPKMNGFETLDTLHFDQATNKIPVLMITNLSDKHYEEESLRRGATKYVVKSQISNKQLVNLVRDIINAYAPKPQPAT